MLPGESGFTHLHIGFEREIELENGQHDHHVVVFQHHPQTLVQESRFEGGLNEWFATFPQDMANFMTTFHADLHLGNPIGLVLTGLLGLTLFASIVTGVIIHRKIFKEFFSFRPLRSLRLLFTDTHKVLGVWCLLFHGVIGFTGAFLGLVVGSLCLFYAQLLLPVTPAEFGYWLGVVFFGSWIAICIYAMLRQNTYRSTKELFVVCGALAIGIPFVNATVTGDAIPLALMNGKNISAGVDSVLLICGLFCLWTAKKLPSARPANNSLAAPEHDTLQTAAIAQTEASS